MPYIENVPQNAIMTGRHVLNPEHNPTILIQIGDTGMPFVTPRYDSYFLVKYQFNFLDISNPLLPEEYGVITQDQADNLVKILDFALKNKYNVLVHCTAGICRSGAVTEVGVIMGFQAVHENRLPNVEVKSKMLGCLYGSR